MSVVAFKEQTMTATEGLESEEQIIARFARYGADETLHAKQRDIVMILDAVFDVLAEIGRVQASFNQIEDVLKLYDNVVVDRLIEQTTSEEWDAMIAYEEEAIPWVKAFRKALRAAKQDRRSDYSEAEKLTDHLVQVVNGDPVLLGQMNDLPGPDEGEYLEL